MGTDLFIADSNMYSCDADGEPRRKSIDETRTNGKDNKDEQRIVARFRVICAAEIEAALAGKISDK
jgi:hypothetical protein